MNINWETVYEFEDEKNKKKYTIRSVKHRIPKNGFSDWDGVEYKNKWELTINGSIWDDFSSLSKAKKEAEHLYKEDNSG